MYRNHDRKKIKRIYLPFLVLFFSACSTSVEFNEGGENHVHKIYCSGSEFDWNTCYENAKKICGDKEYEVLEKYEDQGALAVYGSARVLPDRMLIVQCK